MFDDPIHTPHKVGIKGSVALQMMISMKTSFLLLCPSNKDRIYILHYYLKGLSFFFLRK